MAIKVELEGFVFEVETPEEAAKLFNLLKRQELVPTPPPFVRSRETAPGTPDDKAAAWHDELTSLYLVELSRLGRQYLSTLLTIGASVTPTEIAEALGKKSGKGMGPVRGLIERLAARMGLPSPLQDVPGGRVRLAPEFASAARGKI